MFSAQCCQGWEVQDQAAASSELFWWGLFAETGGLQDSWTLHGERGIHKRQSQTVFDNRPTVEKTP